MKKANKWTLLNRDNPYQIEQVSYSVFTDLGIGLAAEKNRSISVNNDTSLPRGLGIPFISASISILTSD